MKIFTYSKHLVFRIFNFFFSLLSTLKFTAVAMAMLENLCLDKRKNKFVKFSQNLNVLSISCLSLLFLCSCIDENRLEKPKNLIPKDTMTALIIDMLLVSSSKNNKNIYLQSKINYMPFIFEKYKIDSLRFYNSNLYYTSILSENEIMYKEVKIALEKTQNKYKKIKEVKDSIRKDSMLKNKNKLKETLAKKQRLNPPDTTKMFSLKKGF